MNDLQHSGRGGAGNIDRRVDSPAASHPAVFPPELHGPYSTGRGGAANVKSNDSGPRVARIAQDLEGPDRESSRFANSSARGGAGNIRKSQERSRSRGAETPTSGTHTPHSQEGVPGHAHTDGIAGKLRAVFGRQKEHDHS